MEKIGGKWKFSVNNLEDNTLDEYEPYLNRFSEWKQSKREIKLSTLLNEGKKLEFTIELDSKLNSFGGNFIEIIDSNMESEQPFDVSLNKACGVIEHIKFILNGNKVELLEMEIRFLNTEYGKICKKLIEDDFLLIVKQSMSLTGFKKFYITYPDKSEIRDDKITNILKK